MSNREIDRKIHEIIHNDPFKHYEWADPVKPGNSLIARRHGVNYYESVPYYSSSWNAMEVLVEWLGAKDIIVCFNIDTSKAAVTLVQNNRLLADVVSYPAPLALCKAVGALPTEISGTKAIESTEKAQAEEGSD